jgi:CRISPR-associated protein (TIGR03984 family)
MGGLELVPLLSRTEQKCKAINTWQELEQLVGGFLQNGQVVAYLYYKVLIGKVDQGRLEFYNEEKFNPQYLLQLRIFNQDRELHIRRKDASRFLLRYRLDDIGVPIEAVEACQVLWGRSSEVASLQTGWVRLSEKRGVELILPCNKTPRKGSRFWLKTRNYIGYNDLHQAGYIDCRFVEFRAEEVE